MSIYEKAALVLKTNDLTTNSTTTIGSCDQFKTNMTWNNINLRTLLGSMYDNYEKFNICLNAISTAYVQTANPGADPDDSLVQINLGGLPFLNQTYDVARGCNTNNCVIAIFNFPEAVNTFEMMYFNDTTNVATFDKRQNMVNINVFYQRIRKNGQGTYNVDAGGVVYPDMIFKFSIFGIPNDNVNYGQRLINPPNF
jgi:hypothetical protein